MKKAYLVEFALCTRIVLTEEEETSPDREAIMVQKARANILQQADCYLCGDNVTMVEEDTEVPYNEERDNTGHQSQPYHEWEGAVIDRIEELCDCTRSDAQGIVEAQEFYMAQSWAKGLNPEQTARIIDEKSKA